MGLFNYDKPGKGVEKDAPRARGVFLYLELFWRNLGKLILSNLIYFGTSLPILAIYYLMSFAFLSGILPQNADGETLNRVALTATLTIAALWGTGPVSCGLTYVLRNIAREEHTWVCSDFFQKAREGFRHGIVFLLTDIAVLFVGITALSFYRSLAADGNALSILLTVTVITVLVLYTAMHFYIYEMEVTFENRLRDVYKNSFIMAAATLPMCILLGAVIFFVSVTLLGSLSPLGIIFFALVFWMSVTRFIVDFYSARVIKKRFIPEEE